MEESYESKLFTNKIFDPNDELYSIGKSLEDFQEVSKNNSKYTTLGKGQFSFVELMKSEINKQYYAIKKMNKDKYIGDKSLFRELKLSAKLSKLNYPHIAKFYGSFLDEEKTEKYLENRKEKEKDIESNPNYEKKVNIICIVQEYIPNGTLDEHSEQNKKKKRDDYFYASEEKFIYKILKQSLNTLQLFKNNYIIHRDIKIDNILLDENNNIKITDFGLAVYSLD